MKRKHEGMTTQEALWFAEYCRNGFNGQAAYLTIKPNVTPQSASVGANRMLNKSAIQAALQSLTDKATGQGIASRDYLISEAHDIGKEARAEKKHMASLKAVELKGKLNKLFDRDEPEMEGYQKLIQSLFIGEVNINFPGEKAIDITPSPDTDSKSDNLLSTRDNGNG